MSEYSAPTQFIDLAAQQKLIRSEVEGAIGRVLNHGQYIMGPEVSELEQQLCQLSAAKHVISCANGTDAITIVMMAWGVGPGDVVFVPSFTYVASAEAVAQLGATPFFVDVDENTFNISVESLKQAIADCVQLGITAKAVIVVDLFGQPGEITSVEAVARGVGLRVLVDGAQSFGSSIDGAPFGTYGDATTTSFFPSKPLGCYGDGGAIFVRDDETAEKVKSIRLHGRGRHKYAHSRIGLNSRLDSIQACILIEKLKIFSDELKARQDVARRYHAGLSEVVKVPSILEGYSSVWAQYTIVTEQRDELSQRLDELGVPTVVYYPITLCQQDAFASSPVVSTGTNVSVTLAKTVLSLPMHPYLSEGEQSRIIESVVTSLK